MRIALLRAAVLAVAMGFVSAAAAQDGSTGAIRGSVSDPIGTRVAGVQITVINPETAFARRVATGPDGRFSADLLPPGDYDLTADGTAVSKSFANLQRKTIKVEVGGAVELDLKFTLAQPGETVNVSGESPLVDTTKSEVSHTIDELEIKELPLNGRKFIDLSLLTPGVTTDPRSLTSASNGDLAFNGVRGYQTNFLVDGSDNTNSFFGQARGRYRAPYQFSNDTIQEFRVSSNSYSAELGRSGGGVVNVITKSGTNHVHGNIFYYLRDSTFAARPPFVPFKPSDTQNQFGFVLGGPIKRDRVYYFIGFDQHIFHIPNVVEFADGSTVLTPVARPFFSDPPTDYEPSDQALVFDTAAKLTQSAGTFRAALLGNAGFGKIDIALSAKHQLTLRVNTSRYYGDNNVFFDPASPVTNSALNHNGTEEVKTESAAANLLSALSPRWTSHLRVQFSRDDQDSFANSGDVLTRIRQVLDNLGRATILPRATDEKKLFVAETLSRDFGRHSLKFGGDFTDSWISNFFPQLFGGEYIFDQISVDPFSFVPKAVGGLKLSPLRAYAHKVPRFYLQNFGDPTSHPDTQEYSAFVQDSIRVSDHLALNLGLRYDLQVFRGGLEKNPLWPGAGRVPLDTNNFAPRVGFAYSIGNDKPLVFRGGYGLFHARVPQIYNSAVEHNNGIDNASLFLDNRDFFDNLIFPVYPNPLVTCPSQGNCAAPAIATGKTEADVSAFSDKFQTPSVHQANISVEREIVARTAVSASYLYVHGEHLIRARDVNLPPPTDLTYPVFDDSDTLTGFFTIPSFGTWQLTQSATCPQFFVPCINDVQRPIAGLGAINLFESEASSTYNAFTLSARRRMSNGFSLALSYTWANAFDDAQDSPTTGTSQVQNSFATQAERGRSSIDQRNRFVLSWVAEPRPFHREHAVMKAIFNDWKFSGLITAGSGRPLNPHILGDPNRDTNADSDRLPGVARNSFTGPDYTTTDLRLTRKLFTHERFKLDLLVECFNTFNRDNQRVDISDDGFTNNAGQFVFGTQTIAAKVYPASYQTFSSFLKPTSAYAPRQLQFAVKLSF
jgi:hypothetical protein